MSVAGARFFWLQPFELDFEVDGDDDGGNDALFVLTLKPIGGVGD